MKSDIRYITQLTQGDLREIRRAVNLKIGPGISIKRDADGVEIGISAEAFKQMVYSFCRQAWPAACPSADIEGIDLAAAVT